MSRRQNTTLLPQISAGSIPLCLPFFMSRRQNTTLLPQISARSIPLCLLFSCPGVKNSPPCHKKATPPEIPKDFQSRGSYLHSLVTSRRKYSAYFLKRHSIPKDTKHIHNSRNNPYDSDYHSANIDNTYPFCEITLRIYSPRYNCHQTSGNHEHNEYFKFPGNAAQYPHDSKSNGYKA